MCAKTRSAQFFVLSIKFWTVKITLPTAEILSSKNARACVSMVLYLKKINENSNIEMEKKILGAV